MHLGFIGCGHIAHFHGDVFKELGVKIFQYQHGKILLTLFLSQKNIVLAKDITTGKT